MGKNSGACAGNRAGSDRVQTCGHTAEGNPGAIALPDRDTQTETVGFCDALTHTDSHSPPSADDRAEGF